MFYLFRVLLVLSVALSLTELKSVHQLNEELQLQNCKQDVYPTVKTSTENVLNSCKSTNATCPYEELRGYNVIKNPYENARSFHETRTTTSAFFNATGLDTCIRAYERSLSPQRRIAPPQNNGSYTLRRRNKQMLESRHPPPPPSKAQGW
ncbi:hypothetical protein LSTR_LSTR007460 [Laodelphax striatellus]|uniref:Uncharacterized protein n=1 Tax=Laodelphax striatellus TaxID=195883 RepID=A0A482X4D1_LAOST|nr:hypothetical protein LSTR_LSTR007460 [Laodelphax striatellus]